MVVGLRLGVVVFQGALLLLAHPGLDFLHLLGLLIEGDDEVAHDGEVVERRDVEEVRLVGLDELVELGLAGEVCTAVDADRAAAADGVATCLGEAQGVVLLLANLVEAAEQGHGRPLEAVLLLPGLLAVKALDAEGDRFH